MNYQKIVWVNYITAIIRAGWCDDDSDISGGGGGGHLDGGDGGGCQGSWRGDQGRDNVQFYKL